MSGYRFYSEYYEFDFPWGKEYLCRDVPAEYLTHNVCPYDDPRLLLSTVNEALDLYLEMVVMCPAQELITEIAPFEGRITVWLLSYP